MKTKYIFGIFTILILLNSCGPAVKSEKSENQPREAENISTGEIALVNLAHAKFGENSVYRNEVISDAGGYLKVCGEVAPAERSGEFLPFIFSLEVQHRFDTPDDLRWREVCDFGWKPGTGPHG